MTTLKNFRFVFIACSLLVLSACNNLPKHKSELKDDSKIVFANEQFSLQGENTLQDRWWLALNDPILNDLINRALKDNHNLQSALLKIQKVRLSVNTTEANQAFKLNGTAGISNTRVENANTSSNANSFSVGVAASYELDLWNKLSQQVDNAILNVNASILDERALRLSTSAEVANAWYRLLEQVQQLSLLKQQLAITEGYLQLLVRQFKSGQTLAADVIQQRQTVESVKGDHFTTLKEIAKFKSQLAILTGSSTFDIDVKANSVLPVLPSMPKLGLKATVINNRPDVQSAFNQLAIADTTTAISVANRYPSISLSASYNRNGDGLTTIFDNWGSSLAANLLLPIIDGETKKLAVTQNQISYRQSLLAYQRSVLNAVKEVEDALKNEQYQKQYTNSLQKQIELSNQATEQIKSGYINGALDFQRVLNAVLSDQNIQRSYIKAQRQLIEYRISLYRALSGGWTEEQEEKEK